MFNKPICDDLSFVTIWCILLLQAAARQWVHGDEHGQQAYLGRLFH